MKKLSTKLLLLSMVAVLTLFTSCEKKQPVEASEKQDVASATEHAMQFAVDTATSEVNWKGFKFYEKEDKEGGHNGFMKLASGSISYEKDKITAGDFLIDVKTIESQDLNDDPEQKAKLDSHLKNEDFLDVEKYPTATFTITEVKPMVGEYNTLISGNFKMRDIEKNISFKANVTLEDHVLKLDSEEFVIDRQDFGITFKGGGGAVIKDNVALQVHVVANHQM